MDSVDLRDDGELEDGEIEDDDGFTSLKPAPDETVTGSTPCETIAVLPTEPSNPNALLAEAAPDTFDVDETNVDANGQQLQPPTQPPSLYQHTTTGTPPVDGVQTPTDQSNPESSHHRRRSHKRRRFHDSDEVMEERDPRDHKKKRRRDRDREKRRRSSKHDSNVQEGYPDFENMTAEEYNDYVAYYYQHFGGDDGGDPYAAEYFMNEEQLKENEQLYDGEESGSHLPGSGAGGDGTIADGHHGHTTVGAHHQPPGQPQGSYPHTNGWSSEEGDSDGGGGSGKLLDMLGNEETYEDATTAALERSGMFDRTGNGQNRARKRDWLRRNMEKEKERERRRQERIAQRNEMAIVDPSANGDRPDNICKYYLQRKCDKGDACQFSHDVELRKKPGVCKYYMQGFCRHGKSCVFMHEEYPCKYYHLRDSCNVEHCRFSHLPPATDEQREVLRRMRVEEEEDRLKKKPSLLDPSVSGQDPSLESNFVPDFSDDNLRDQDLFQPTVHTFGDKEDFHHDFSHHSGFSGELRPRFFNQRLPRGAPPPARPNTPFRHHFAPAFRADVFGCGFGRFPMGQHRRFAGPTPNWVQTAWNHGVPRRLPPPRPSGFSRHTLGIPRRPTGFGGRVRLSGAPTVVTFSHEWSRPALAPPPLPTDSWPAGAVQNEPYQSEAHELTAGTVENDTDSQSDIDVGMELVPSPQPTKAAEAEEVILAPVDSVEAPTTTTQTDTANPAGEVDTADATDCEAESPLPALESTESVESNTHDQDTSLRLFLSLASAVHELIGATTSCSTDSSVPNELRPQIPSIFDLNVRPPVHPPPTTNVPVTNPAPPVNMSFYSVPPPTVTSAPPSSTSSNPPLLPMPPVNLPPPNLLPPPFIPGIRPPLLPGLPPGIPPPPHGIFPPMNMPPPGIATPTSLASQQRPPQVVVPQPQQLPQTSQPPPLQVQQQPQPAQQHLLARPSTTVPDFAASFAPTAPPSGPTFSPPYRVSPTPTTEEESKQKELIDLVRSLPAGERDSILNKLKKDHITSSPGDSEATGSPAVADLLRTLGASGPKFGLIQALEEAGAQPTSDSPPREATSVAPKGDPRLGRPRRDVPYDPLDTDSPASPTYGETCEEIFSRVADFRGAYRLVTIELPPKKHSLPPGIGHSDPRIMKDPRLQRLVSMSDPRFQSTAAKQIIASEMRKPSPHHPPPVTPPALKVTNRSPEKQQPPPPTAKPAASIMKKSTSSSILRDPRRKAEAPPPSLVSPTGKARPPVKFEAGGGDQSDEDSSTNKLVIDIEPPTTGLGPLNLLDEDAASPVKPAVNLPVAGEAAVQKPLMSHRTDPRFRRKPKEEKPPVSSAAAAASAKSTKPLDPSQIVGNSKNVLDELIPLGRPKTGKAPRSESRKQMLPPMTERKSEQSALPDTATSQSVVHMTQSYAPTPFDPLAGDDSTNSMTDQKLREVFQTLDPTASPFG